MHAGQLIELAVQIAFQSTRVIEQTPDEIVDAENYWNLSKEKLDRWNKTLKIFKDDLNRRDGHDSWTAIACVVEEILCSEFFARVSSAVFVMKDEYNDQHLNAPVSRSIFLFHLEARMRSLELIEMGLEKEVPEAAKLNDLRRRLESWCDLLLAFLKPSVAREFAFDQSRFREFLRDIAEENESSKRNVARLLQVSICEHGRKLLAQPIANPTLNERIGKLFEFLTESTPATPTVKSYQAINQLSEEAEKWIDDYLLLN